MGWQHPLVGAITGEALDVLFGGSHSAGARAADPVTVISHICLRWFSALPLYTRRSLLSWAFMYVRVSRWKLRAFSAPAAMAAQRLYGLYQEQRQLGCRPLRSKRNARTREPSVRGRTHRHSRRARSLHSRPLCRGRRVLPRYRQRMGLPDESDKRSARRGLGSRHRKNRPTPWPPRKARRAHSQERRRCSITRKSATDPSSADTYSEIATIVRHHHERIDGRAIRTGWGDMDIPLVSRSLRSPTPTTR